MKRIDLNCDMGESYGIWKMGADAEIMPFEQGNDLLQIGEAAIAQAFV